MVDERVSAGALMTFEECGRVFERVQQAVKSRGVPEVEALFAAHDQVAAMLAIATGAVAPTKFNTDRLRAAASNPVLFATDGADYLVHKGLPSARRTT